jgi:hypothetical protein
MKYEMYCRRLHSLWFAAALLSISTIITSGCSAVNKIQNNANDIRTLAEESRQEFVKIDEAATATPPRISEIKERSNQGISKQTEIIEKTEVVISATSGVKDIVPWWATTIEVVVIGLAILGVSFMLWYSGLGLLVKRLIGYIPSAKVQEAKLLSEALDEQNKTTIREAVAAMRAMDPELNKAFEKKNAKL